ncbi:aromatase/cyclase [Streptomyces yerevanensis]|uniref:aromatase/cyclase n=1 Tax=Streptomyces yerevanensis TaxID=66378 RepID=UPI000526D4FF|nr:SRPBCC family protein [Streptomyces yerevanensis]
MPAPAVHRTSHRIEVAAPAGVVYGFIADAKHWPLFCAPNVYVEQLDLEGPEQRLRMWALNSDGVTSWVTRRTLDPGARRIEFRHETGSGAVDGMLGIWSVEQLPGGSSVLTLVREFPTVDDRLPADPIGDAAIRRHMADLKRLTESWTVLDELVLTVEDAVRVDGPAELVYGFLYRAGAWTGSIPGLRDVHLDEDVPGIQMVRTTAEGAEKSRAVRLCFPGAGLIVYSLTDPPALIAGQAGEWSVEPDPTGVSVRVRHQVVLNEQDVTRVLGEDADLSDARRYVRETITRDSATLLGLARRHAEDAADALGLHVPGMS